MENGCVVQLCACSEPAEFSGVLCEGEISPDKGEDAGGELHRREGGNNGKQKTLKKTGRKQTREDERRYFVLVGYSVTVPHGDPGTRRRGL